VSELAAFDLWPHKRYLVLRVRHVSSLMLLLLLLCRRHFRSSSFHVCLYPVVYSRYPTPRGWPTSPRTVVEDRYDASCSIGGRAGRYYRSPPSTKPISVAARLITRWAVVTYAACKEVGLDNVTVCSSLPSTTEPVIRLALFCPSVRPSVCLYACLSARLPVLSKNCGWMFMKSTIGRSPLP